MRIIDMHCDTLSECYHKKYGLRSNSGQLDLEKMKRMGALAQFFAIYLPEGEALPPYQLFQEIYRLYEAEMEGNRDLIRPAVCCEDLAENERAGKMSSILTIEDGQMLDGRLERLDECYEKGVRLITLLWCRENCIGFPDHRNPEENSRGLKPFGFQVVERMEELGMIVDVSHLSEGGFDDVVRCSRKPFVASHSCARKLCGHSRNLTDRQLRCLAERGGVVGVNYNSYFLREECGFSRIEDILAHIDHMLCTAGTEAVALGSDFDGIECGLEMEDYGQYGRLIGGLEKRYSCEVVEKICYRNALRILKECW